MCHSGSPSRKEFLPSCGECGHRQPLANGIFRICLSHFNPIVPSSTAEKPGTEPGGLIKVRPCQSHSRAEASGSLVADWHLPLCNPIFFPFFSPVWSLIKSLHPKLQLSICFRRTQSITHAPESLILFFSLYQDHYLPPRSSSNDTFKKYFLILPMRNNYSFYSTPLNYACTFI